MTEEDLSPVAKIAITIGLFIGVLVTSGAIGYLIWLLGNDNSTRQATDWVTGGKRGFLLLSLIPVAYVLSIMGSSLKDLLNLKLPHFLSQAILIGFTFAILDGVGVLLGIETGEFWFKVLNGFIIGCLGGGIGVALAQKTEKEKLDKNSVTEESTS